MKNKKTIIICILFVVIIGIILIKPIKKEIYSIQFKKDVKEFLIKNYNVINTVEISGDYSLNINLSMNKDFCSLDFLEQSPTIKSIANDLSDLYITYRNKVNKIDYNINYNHGMIKFNIDDYFYNTNLISSTIYKNGNNDLEYTDNYYLVEQINSKISLFNIDPIEKDYIEKYLNGIENINTYKYLLNIEDDNTLILEIAYQYLLKLSNENEYSESIFYYKSKLTDYKDSIELLNKIDEYEKNRKEKYFSVPRIGMTKQEVLNTKWGEPKGKAEDKPNTGLRVNEDGEEGFFYVRGTTKIMVSFKDGKVNSFYITKKGDVMATQVYSVEGY